VSHLSQHFVHKTKDRQLLVLAHTDANADAAGTSAEYAGPISTSQRSVSISLLAPFSAVRLFPRESYATNSRIGKDERGGASLIRLTARRNCENDSTTHEESFCGYKNPILNEPVAAGAAASKSASKQTNIPMAGLRIDRLMIHLAEGMHRAGPLSLEIDAAFAATPKRTLSMCFAFRHYPSKHLENVVAVFLESF
jgi:hypothetical protein